MDFPKWAESQRLFVDDAVHEKFVEWYGAETVKALSLSMRMPPSITTLRAFRSTDDIEQILKGVKEAVGTRTVECHPLIKNCIVVNPGTKEALPRHVNTVVVDVRCGEAILRGADIFAPGVLGSTSKFDTGVNLNIMIPKSKQTTPLKGEMIDRDKCTPEEEAFVHIASGVSAMPRVEILKPNATGTAIRVTHRLVNHPPMGGVCSTSAMLQNIPSMLPPILLDPKPGMRVIDMCAAPGGKTVHVADMMGNAGEVVALDRSAKRLEELKQLAERAEMSCIEAVKYDSTKAGKKWKERSFDRVMLDPPCSGLGLRPKLCHDVSMAALEQFADYQRRLMTVALSLCKPGGRIVYSTCTISPLENEGNVAWFLGQYADKVVLEEQTDRTAPYYALGESGLPNVGLEPAACKHVIRFTPPTADSPYTGFFVASFIKKAEQ